VDYKHYDIWLKDPKHYLPSAQLVHYIVGQDILNSDVGNYFQGIHITSGVWKYRIKYLELIHQSIMLRKPECQRSNSLLFTTCYEEIHISTSFVFCFYPCAHSVM
jgi:hypothetical protein